MKMIENPRVCSYLIEKKKKEKFEIHTYNFLNSKFFKIIYCLSCFGLRTDVKIVTSSDSRNCVDFTNRNVVSRMYVNPRDD